MARIVHVAEPSDARLADYVSLRDVELRSSVETEYGLFLAEGEKVVRRAVGAAYPVRSLLMAPRWLDALRDVLDRAGDVPCYVAEPDVIEAVTGFHVHRGALASLHRRPLPSIADVLVSARRVVVFEDLVDHTNLGAGFRAAAALGVNAVLITPRCADPLYRRSIKVSMGAVFQVPWTRIERWPRDLQLLREEGYAIAALALTEESISLDELVTRRHDKLALILGSEGHGLQPSTIAAADVTVRIPMFGGVDSLNVGSAAAVAFYATRSVATDQGYDVHGRQRLRGQPPTL